MPKINLNKRMDFRFNDNHYYQESVCEDNMNDIAETIHRRGMMFALSSPSGAGKTSLSRKLLQDAAGITMSISMTTRQRRPGEVSGQDYHFVSESQFRDAIDAGHFLEWAKVFGHYYGTPRKPVEDALAQGTDVLFDIDWQGTQQLNELSRGDLVSVFILPPSWEELERRLINRAQDPENVVAERMSKAAEEISHWAEYDYVIVNHNLDQCVGQVSAILQAERLKRSRQVGLHDFLKKLTQKL